MAATAILLEKLISTIYNKISERTLENEDTNVVDEKTDTKTINKNYETKNREIKIKNNYKIIDKKIF